MCYQEGWWLSRVGKQELGTLSQGFDWVGLYLVCVHIDPPDFLKASRSQRDQAQGDQEGGNAQTNAKTLLIF